MDIHDDSGKSGDSFSSYYPMEGSFSSISISPTGPQDGNDVEAVHKNNCTADTTDPSLNKENHTGNVIAVHEKSDGEGEVQDPSGTDEAVRFIGSIEGSGNRNDHSNDSFLLNTEADSPLWYPPEPEDLEDDGELSVANNDEDDDYIDGTEWGQPSSFSSLDEQQGCILSDKEKQRKAMMEAMHTQFKFLVSRFLASEGIVSSEGEDGDRWVDIVTSLSWQAALLVKPDATEGRAMDPGYYVKVKCIACGSRIQSQVIKGLVFKKNTAHKHMPTNFRNARLLLLKGVLGERVSGLSSFNSMEQEKGYVKSVIEIMEALHPNVVLVEKTASRDAQEYLLAKGITLVFDMKFPRLERIGRCTGSRIIDCAEITMNTELKKCDFFHVEKFVEEHTSSNDGGKRSSKTLMFFEGFPKPLGCTILLKGAHSDELKKVKRVMQYTVFAAYHLILETSFFADQRAMSFDMNALEKQIGEKENDVIFPSSDKPNSEVLSPESLPKLTVEIMAPNASKESSGLKRWQSELMSDTEGPSAVPRMPAVSSHSKSGVHGSLHRPGNMHHDKASGYTICQPETSHDLFKQLLPGQFLPSFEYSHNKLQADNLLLDSTYSYDPCSPYYHLNASGSHCFLEIANGEKDAGSELEKGKMENGLCVSGQNVSVSDFNESLNQLSNASRNSILSDNDNAAVMLDTQSILILFSSRRTSKETVCEQNQLSRIKYYGNCDMSLGWFLQYILLSQIMQRHSCLGCGEPPEAHVYSYTHQNGKLTVQVRQLPPKMHLPGEKDGKLWMWTRCLKCERESGFPRPTKRVIMSTAARGLSFGKFLELSFSSHSAAKMLSQCGHLLHRDCLRFFGFGSKVAMFRYSPVEIYTACKPPPVIEFNSPITQEWFEKEAKDVKHMGEEFFSEVTILLQTMWPDLSRLPLTLPGSIKGFSEVEEALKQEMVEFEASMLIATKYHGNLGKSSPKTVNLQYLRQVLLFGLYVWDCRLSYLQLSKGAYGNYGGAPREKGLLDKCDDRRNAVSDSFAEDIPVELVQMDLEQSSASNSHFIRNIEIEQETCAKSLVAARNEISHVDATTIGSWGEASSNSTGINGSKLLSLSDGLSDMSFNLDESDIHSICLQMDSDAHITSECLKHGESSKDLDMEIEGLRCNGDLHARFASNGQHVPSVDSAVSSADKASGPEDWIWLPFPEMHQIFLKEHHRIYMKRFEGIHSHNFRYLASLYQKMALQDREHLHFPLGSEGIIISIREEEISSIIACALTKLYDQYSSLEIPEMELGVDAERGTESTLVSPSDASLTTSFWSSNGSLNLERVQSYQSFSSSHSSDEVSSSGFDNSFENLPSSENLHLNISMADDKATGKCKYSVACIYAKQFYSLRKRCCPSELDYISSLSRCRKWDAQGGKSKALFAKTLDDRFIIKEIKRTELDSFLKFGPEYFKHILHSLNSGSQTCLAKILGLYQVKQIKGGKETRYDLMVMENLLYGRDVTRTYDLKGAVYARYISDPNKPEKVLLDQNFVEDMGLSPMYIGGRTKQLLQRAIWNDTSFLTAINVMDYSLLVGVDKKRRELIFGIIDYLRQYTWDKQLETWVKSSLVPKNSLPTVISPKEYKKRFRKFMSKYFLTVPDSWASDSCPDRSKPCSNGIANSS